MWEILSGIVYIANEMCHIKIIFYLFIYLFIFSWHSFVYHIENCFLHKRFRELKQIMSRSCMWFFFYEWKRIYSCFVLFISLLTLLFQLSRDKWNAFNQCNLAKCVCLSQARIWIAYVICRDHLCVQIIWDCGCFVLLIL